MSEFVRNSFRHDSSIGTKITRQAAFDGKTNDSGKFLLQFFASKNLILHSITFYGIRNNNMDAQSNIHETIINVDAKYNSDNYIFPEDEREFPSEITFNLGDYVVNKRDRFSITLTAKKGIYFFLNYYENIVKGSEGNVGVVNEYVTCPDFKIEYSYLDNVDWFLNSSVNNGYPYLDGLITDYGKFQPIQDVWLIDKEQETNEGYPYFEGLATEYGKFKPIASWYYNSNSYVVYYNGSIVVTNYKGDG